MFGPPVPAATTTVASATVTASALAAPTTATATIVPEMMIDQATGQRDATLLLALDDRSRRVAPGDNPSVRGAADRHEATSESAAAEWDEALLSVLDDDLV